MKDPNQSCTTCVHRDPSPTQIGFGGCHRLPPVLLPDGRGGATQFWPFVGPQDWCGEFKPTYASMS